MLSEQTKVVLTVVRHGETASNKAGVLQGQLNTPLNDLGIEQAKLAGSRLKATKFDSVFASDLKRVLQTTSGILKENDSLKDASFDEIVQTNILIRERNFGEMEGKPITEYVNAANAVGIKKAYKFVPKGGESSSAVRDRAKEFVKSMLLEAQQLEKDEWNVLLVSHGGWIRELIGHMLQDHSCSGIPIKSWMQVCPNTGITQFHISVYRLGDLRLASAECVLFQCKKHLEQLSEKPSELKL